MKQFGERSGQNLKIRAEVQMMNPPIESFFGGFGRDVYKRQFLTLAARPAAVALVLAPFGSSVRQQLVVSWAGLRGAASIVFAITAAVSPAYGDDRLFHICLLSTSRRRVCRSPASTSRSRPRSTP